MDISNLFNPIFERLNLLGDFLFVGWVLWALFVFWNLKHDGRGRDRFLSGMKVLLSQIYLRKLEWMLDRAAEHWFRDKEMLDDVRLHEVAAEHRLHRWLGVNAFTVPSFEFALRLALFYPILSVITVWVWSGEGGSFGELQVLKPQDSPTLRLVLVAALLIVAWASYKFVRTESRVQWVYVVVAGVVAFAFAFAVAVAGVVAGVVAFAVAVAGVVAVAVAVAFAGVVAVAVAGAFAGAVAFAGAWDWLYSRITIRKKLYYFWWAYTLFYLLLSVMALLWLGQQGDVQAEGFSLLIFLSLLPLLNAPLDWLSLGITRSLLYAIVDRVHSGYRAFLWAVFDGVLAFGFLLLLTLVMVVALSGINVLSASLNGQQIINLRLIFDGLATDPLRPEFWWLYFILFSTLIPTMLHMLVASWSLFLWLPQHWLDWSTRAWRVKQLQYDSFKFFGVWGYWTLFAPLVLLAPLLLLGLLWLILKDWGHGVYLGGWLLTVMQNLAQTIDPSF